MNLDELVYTFALDPENANLNFDLGFEYQKIGHTASALSHYLRCAERTDDLNLVYECFIKMFFCFESQGNRRFSAKHMLNHAITILPKRPEAYFLLSRFYERSCEWWDCYTISCIALTICDFDSPPLRTWTEYPGKYGILFEKALSSWWWDKVEDAKTIFVDLLDNYNVSDEYRNCILENLKKC